MHRMHRAPLLLLPLLLLASNAPLRVDAACSMEGWHSTAALALEQAQKYPEREDVLEAWLERAEPRCRYLHDQITTTGGRILRKLHGTPAVAQAAK